MSAKHVSGLPVGGAKVTGHVWTHDTCNHVVYRFKKVPNVPIATSRHLHGDGTRVRKKCMYEAVDSSLTLGSHSHISVLPHREPVRQLFCPATESAAGQKYVGTVSEHAVTGGGHPNGGRERFVIKMKCCQSPQGLLLTPAKFILRRTLRGPKSKNRLTRTNRHCRLAPDAFKVMARQKLMLIRKK